MRLERVVTITEEFLVCDCCQRETSSTQSITEQEETFSHIRLGHAQDSIVECDLCHPCISTLLAEYLRPLQTMPVVLTNSDAERPKYDQAPLPDKAIMTQIEF